MRRLRRYLRTNRHSLIGAMFAAAIVFSCALLVISVFGEGTSTRTVVVPLAPASGLPRIDAYGLPIGMPAQVVTGTGMYTVVLTGAERRTTPCFGLTPPVGEYVIITVAWLVSAGSADVTPDAWAFAQLDGRRIDARSGIPSGCATLTRAEPLSSGGTRTGAVAFSVPRGVAGVIEYTGPNGPVASWRTWR